MRDIYRKIKLYLRIKMFKMYRIMNRIDRLSKPIDDMSESQSAVLDIFIKSLNDKDSILYYDLNTQECYVHSQTNELYIFVESRNIKIINSVYGYDVATNVKMENYLVESFKREMSIRRNKFKMAAMNKVKYSLNTTLDRLNRDKE